MSTETTVSTFLSVETEQPDNNHTSHCTKPLPARGETERMDMLIGLRLLGEQGQKALVHYLQTKQAQKEQKEKRYV